MSHDHFGNKPFPRGALLGAGLLIAASIAFAATARHQDIGTVRTQEGVVESARLLQFEDGHDGSIRVLDQRTGTEVAHLESGTNGFLRGVLRALVRERRIHEATAKPPFQLTRWNDGRVTLEDPATGERIDLHAFGQTNLEAFTRLLDRNTGT